MTQSSSQSRASRQYSHQYPPNPYRQSHPAPYYRVPAPSLVGTFCLLIGISVAYGLYPSGETPTDMARFTAISTGIAFLLSVLVDSKKGLHNLLRTDLLCIFAIYGLTLAEFLFPQDDFNNRIDVEGITHALNAVLLGMTGLTIGRHFVTNKLVRPGRLSLQDVSINTLFRVVVICALFGYLYMLISVHFNPVTLINQMLAPRFSQPWSRGRLGGWASLLTELTLLSYAIPPIVGVIWNRRHHFPKAKMLIVLAIFALVIFQGFASGTRNIFITHIATFLMGYLITLPKNTFKNTVLPIIATILISGFASYHMLEFREIGLRNYIAYQSYASNKPRDTFAVDYNLASIAPLINTFPERHPFLGSEVLVWSLVRPIPRALWPGKPEGLTVSIEELAGADGWTVAATYLGESYMMAGWFGILGVSLFLGALAAWWNRMAIKAQSDYTLVIYALGFFAAGITMRSLFWLTTAILPIIALMVFRKARLVR
ncbi:MAG: O-antigen polymerase [Leptolyngbyaceae bacterium]|nr:O-antigen polymerase [Leptolyngbyaceae bacterium]